MAKKESKEKGENNSPNKLEGKGNAWSSYLNIQLLSSSSSSFFVLKELLLSFITFFGTCSSCCLKSDLMVFVFSQPFFYKLLKIKTHLVNCKPTTTKKSF